MRHQNCEGQLGRQNEPLPEAVDIFVQVLFCPAEREYPINAGE
jgi:hypothetical protein